MTPIPLTPSLAFDTAVDLTQAIKAKAVVLRRLKRGSRARREHRKELFSTAAYRDFFLNQTTRT